MTAGGSSIAEVQRLLSALAASKANGAIAEIGTAFGEGATAIMQALGPDASFVTVEPDADRYAHAVKALDGTPAEVLNARWEDVLPQRGPFDLIFFDGGTRAETVNLAIKLLAPGGILIKDDLTPGAPIEGDAVREAFLTDERLVGVELLAVADMAVIIATRRTEATNQTEARLIGAIDRIISVAPREQAPAHEPTRVRAVADDAIDMIEQVRKGTPDGSTRRQRYDRLLARLREWNKAT